MSAPPPPPIPAPPVPAEVDCRGLPFMPLDVVRLLDSDIFALSSGEEFKAAVALWCKAWLQVPAGSLPDDDRVLAHLSGAGARWRKVREMALRGFVKCSDGRLYHRVVCEKALDAWERRVAQRHKAARRWERDEPPAASPPAPPAGDAAASAPAVQGTGTGTEAPAQQHSDAAREAELRVAVGTRVLAAAGIDPARWVGSFALVSAWLAAGYDPDLDVVPTVAAVARRPGYAPGKPLSYFTKAIAQAWQERQAAPAVPQRIAARASSGNAVAPAGIHSESAEKFLQDVAERNRARQRAARAQTT